MSSSRKGLGKVLRRISEKTEGKKPTIVDTIDSACVEGATAVGAFSLIGVRRAMKKMLRTLEEGDFKREEFFAEFSKLYSLVMAPDKRSYGVFHPSQLLDGCERAFAYELGGTPPSNKVLSTISPSLQRIFDTGTWYHIYIQNILYAKGVLEQAEVPVINKERYINGKADGVIKESVYGERVVLEIKTMNSWSYQRAVFRPFKKHEFQASLYARELGIKKVVYLYINKDTSEIKEFLMPINEEELAVADKKMDNVINHIKEGTLPKRSCDTPRCDRAFSCIFRDLCFKE